MIYELLENKNECCVSGFSHIVKKREHEIFNHEQFTIYIDIRYTLNVIKTFGNKTAADIYHGSASKHARKLPVNLHDKTRRLLDQLNAAPIINFLKVPPGNRLEKLSGDYKGFWSIRINDQWRIVFKWLDDDAYDISIVD